MKSKDFFASYSPGQIERGSERLLRVVIPIIDQIRMKLKHIDIELNSLLLWSSKSKLLDSETQKNVVRATKKMRKIGDAALGDLEKKSKEVKG